MTQDLRLPQSADFPQFPKSWYFLGRADQFTDRIRSFEIWGKTLIAFRKEDGSVAVMDGFCPHMGALLAGGCLEKDHVVCPYHGWKYDAQGHCTDSPGKSAIPSFAKLNVYPTEERHGFVFAFNGKKAQFPLPFFFGEQPDHYQTGRPFHFIAESPWYMLGAHAFDERHLEYVHDRKLMGSLKADKPNNWALRVTHTSEVMGENIFDRLIRIFLGRVVTISMSPVGGTFVLVTGDFRNLKSRFFLMITPLTDHRSRVDGIVFSQRRSWFLNWLSPIELEIRRWFTKGYLVAENQRLGRHHYIPARLDQSDQLLIQYYRWLGTLGKSPTAETQSPAEIEL